MRPPPWAFAQFLENEFEQDDFNKFVFLLKKHLRVGVLSELTQGELQRSQRYREILTPLGVKGDEVRLVCVSNASCWGMACLHRDRSSPPFTPAEAAFLTQLTPHIAEGLRKALLLEHAPCATTPAEPGVLVLSEDLSVVTMTPVAQYWLAELAQGEKTGKQALPSAVVTVVARLRGIEHGMGTTPESLPKVRVRTPSGHWLVLYASRLNGSGDQRQTAVLFELAQSVELAPLLMQTYQLTKREAEVTRLILRGWATTEIAATLQISQNTVQDHLKAIFEKTDVRSRRELTGRIFAQHYHPQFSKEKIPRLAEP